MSNNKLQRNWQRKVPLKKLAKWRAKTIASIERGKTAVDKTGEHIKDPKLQEKVDYLQKVDAAINDRQGLPYRVSIPLKKQKQLGIFNGIQYHIT